MQAILFHENRLEARGSLATLFWGRWHFYPAAPHRISRTSGHPLQRFASDEVYVIQWFFPRATSETLWGRDLNCFRNYAWGCGFCLCPLPEEDPLPLEACGDPTPGFPPNIVVHWR